MDTCIICHNAYDPIWDESGKTLLNPDTQICIYCYQKIENGEIKITPELEELLEHIERVEEK